MRNQSIMSHKENWAPLERRLSLKYSSAIQSKNNPRMSIPVRRDSIATTTAISPFADISNYKDARPSFASIPSIQLQKPAKKQIILTNLIGKLDHQQELKQIIYNKIKNSRAKESFSYFESGESTEILESKLRGCQEEIQCFKDLVRQLVDKISSLERRTSRGYQDPPTPTPKRKTKQFGTQTEQIQNRGWISQRERMPQRQRGFIKSCNTEAMDESQDFLQNLNKTLKVLSGKKSR